MTEAITNSAKEIVTGLFVLLGVLIGTLIPLVKEYFSSRKAFLKEFNKAVFAILEVWHIYDLNRIDFLLKEIQKIFEKYEIGKDELKKVISLIVSDFLQPIKLGFQSEKIESIKSEYDSAVLKLSELNPILAFQLRGKESYYESVKKCGAYIFDYTEKYLSNPGDKDDFNKFMTEIYNEGEKDIPSDIRGCLLEYSLRYDVILYCKLHIFFWRKKRSEAKEAKRLAEKIRDKIQILEAEIIRNLEKENNQNQKNTGP